MELYLTISLFLVLCKFGGAMPAEPVCSSFDFQFKTLETMLRTEQSVQRLNEDTRSKHESIEAELKKFELELTTEFDKLKANTAEKQEQLNEDTRSKHESIEEVLKEFKLELTTEFDKLKANTAKQLTEKQVNLLTTQAEERLQKFNLFTTQAEERLQKFNLFKTQTEERLQKFNLFKTQTEERLQKFNLFTTQAEERLQKFNLFTTQAEERLQKLNLLTTQADERLQSVDDAVTAMKNRDTTVAFSVTYPTKSLKNGVPTFNTAITNIGGAYNMATGVFTSPVDGLYMFVFTVQSNGKYQVSCRIKHNGDEKAFARTYFDNSYTSASTSVYIHVTKGDTVTLGGCGGWPNVDSNSHRTAFSGALINQKNLN